MEDQAKKSTTLSIQILFYALGVVALLPLTFLDAPTDYWMYKFRDVNGSRSYDSDPKTDLQNKFFSDFYIAANVCFVVFIVLTLRLRRRANILHIYFITLPGATLMFILACIFINVDTDSWQDSFLTLSIVIACILLACSGTFLVTLLHMARKFPGDHIPTIFAGYVISGIFAALAEIIALGLDKGPQTTAVVYFVMATILLAVPTVAFWMLWQKSEYFRQHFTKEVEPRQQRTRPEISVILAAIDKSKIFLVSLVIVLVCTALVDPGVIESVVSANKGSGSRWSDKLFDPVVNIFLNSFCDFIGREAAKFFRKPTNGLIILGLSCFRILFVPLILFCNVQPRYNSSVAFDDDSAYIVFVIIFAFSNGYLVNINILNVEKITDENEKEREAAMSCVMLLIVLRFATSSGISNAVAAAL